LDHDAGGEVGGVGEFPAQADIAGGVDARVGRAETVIHLHTLPRIILHADSFEVESLDVWNATGTGENFTTASDSSLPCATK